MALLLRFQAKKKVRNQTSVYFNTTLFDIMNEQLLGGEFQNMK